MLQAALPQTTLPKLDRMTVATLVARADNLARTAQSGTGPRSGPFSGAMAFADYFEILATFSDPKVQTTRQDVPYIPALDGVPWEGAEQAVSEMKSDLAESSKPVQPPAELIGEESPEDAEPFVQIAPDVARFAPSELPTLNPRPTDAVTVSDRATDELAKSPKTFRPSDAVSVTYIPQNQTDKASDKGLHLTIVGAESSRKGAGGDIFSVLHQPADTLHPSPVIGASRHAEAAHVVEADEHEMPLSAPVSRVFAENKTDKMTVLSPVKDAHPPESVPRESTVGSADTIGPGTSVPEDLPFVSPQQEQVLPDLELIHAQRSAPETVQTTLPTYPADQFPMGRTKQPFGSMLVPEAGQPARIKAFHRQPIIRDGLQTTMPRQEILPQSGHDLTRLNHFVSEPIRTTVAEPAGESTELSPDSLAKLLGGDPDKIVTVPVKTIAPDTSGLETLQPASPRQEPALNARSGQLWTELTIADPARTPVTAHLVHRATPQLERDEKLRFHPEQVTAVSADERPRDLPVHVAGTKTVAEPKQASQTEAFSAPAFATIARPVFISAPEQVTPEHLPDIPLMADFSITSFPVEGLQALTRPSLALSKDPIRQVFQNVVLPSNRIKEGPVEIRLNPEELGHVRINISVTEGMIALSIHAERSETLELLRRNIEQLSQEFRQIGYGNISFSFGQNARQHDGRHKAMSDNRGIANSGTDNPQNLPSRPHVGGPGVDLRV